MWTKFAAEISPGRNLSHQREAGVTSRPVFEVPATAASEDSNGTSRPAFEVPSTAASADGGKSDSPVPGSKRGNPSPYHSPGNDAASLSNDVHGLKRQGILGTPKKLFASMFDDNSFVEDSAGNDDDDVDDDVIDCSINKDGDGGNNGGSWVSDAAFTDEEIFSEVNTRAKKDRVAASLLSNDALVSKLTVGLKQLGYVSFSSDWQAAGAVSVALGQKTTLCEFGTGTGKTMTFLLPSVCAHEQRDDDFVCDQREYGCVNEQRDHDVVHEKRDDGPVLDIFPLIALSRNMVVGTRERTGLGPRAVVALDGGSSKLARDEIICQHLLALALVYVLEGCAS